MRTGMTGVISLLTLSGIYAQAAFTDITDSSGLVHQYRVHEGLFGGGACVLDYNQDGYQDIYLTGGLADDQLLRNNGDGTLTDVYRGSGLELSSHFVTQGVVSADVNRDGYPDLFITTNTSRDSLQIIPRARNLLFLGQADHTFRDATEEYGLTPLYSFSTGASFGDFNADGWPDLYVGNYFVAYEDKLDHISDATIVGATQTSKGYLLINREGKRFENVYEEYGLTHRGFGFGGTWTDYDNDGDQDLLVHHDFGYKATPDLLLENLYPKAGFRDVAGETGMDLRINSMASAVGDYDGDGRLDYYVSNIKFNPFMVGSGSPVTYTDRSKELGMNYVSVSWGANFGDFDQDGDLDLFVSNGDLNPNCTPLGNFYFDNVGGRFVERARAVGLADYGIGRGSVAFDLENDGDLDLLAVCQNAVLPNYPVATVTRLWRNDTEGAGNWLKVHLRGSQGDLGGLGARVTLFTQGRRMIREVDGGSSSHLSQNSRLLHFGLGAAHRIDSVLVTWVGGKEQLLLDQPVNQLLVIEEPPGGRPGSRGYGFWVAIGLGAVLLVLAVVLRYYKRSGTTP